jgi:2-amino-4-hydroxy-6-hydroxymethyldihydropteridine diphosphokinase
MVLLGLGSNMDDRLSYLDKAVKRLSEVLQDLRVSSVVETAAMLPENAPANWDIPFLNLVVRGKTHLSPAELLIVTKTIEVDLGRIFRGKWGPREIDIDILTIGDMVLNTPELTIPHIGLFDRDFVLAPFCELASDWRYPAKGEYFGKRAGDIAKSKGYSLERMKVTRHA